MHAHVRVRMQARFDADTVQSTFAPQATQTLTHNNRSFICQLALCHTAHSRVVSHRYLLFKKYLAIYCERMLTANLPQSSTIASVILKDASVKLSPEEQFLTCCILNTAEYCLETTSQLEGKLKQKVRA
jgi:hypothetical protein